MMHFPKKHRNLAHDWMNIIHVFNPSEHLSANMASNIQDGCHYSPFDKNNYAHQKKLIKVGNLNPRWPPKTHFNKKMMKQLFSRM